MKNWITVVEDGSTEITAYFPVTRVRLVLESEGFITFHLGKGKIEVEGVGVEKLVSRILSEGEPILKGGVAGIKSVKYDRGLL